jgi:hypothetical protein
LPSTKTATTNATGKCFHHSHCRHPPRLRDARSPFGSCSRFLTQCAVCRGHAVSVQCALQKSPLHSGAPLFRQFPKTQGVLPGAVQVLVSPASCPSTPLLCLTTSIAVSFNTCTLERTGHKTKVIQVIETAATSAMRPHVLHHCVLRPALHHRMLVELTQCQT